jgi:CxxC motif-containing protein (DUF1111 family)
MVHSVSVGLANAGADALKPDAVAAGYEIFNREWMANDPRGHGGDGLGPVFNDSSCVACHNSGGSGGAGSVSKNIDILSASRNGMPVQAVPAPAVETAAAAPGTCAPSSAGANDLAPLADLHAGFKAGRIVVLHKFGTDPNYDLWRARMFNPSANASANPIVTGISVFGEAVVNDGGAITRVTASSNDVFLIDEGGASTRRKRSSNDLAMEAAMVRVQQIRTSVAASNPAMSQRVNVGNFIVSRSQRNPTPLFGLGLIDAIPDQAIEAMAKREAKDSPATAGRVSKLKDGRVGRLGWKGQTANTEDFVLNACAVELGLEVPGHHQAITPQAPKYQATGLDLSADECSSLVAYVRSLPKPEERRPTSSAEANHIEAGRSNFASIGCAGCHAAKLGNVVGIYSDLLLHDMGTETADDGSYDGSDDGADEPLLPLAANGDDEPQAQPKPRAQRAANRREWRTPPLWGFRDSAPYLHDGRAQTLDQAIAMHGGQGQASALKFFQLSPRERQQVESFLKSLVAPAPARVQVAQVDR